MSNIVFIMDIDIGGEGRYASERRSSYGYSISSWRKWCDKNDCELFVLNDLVFDNNRMGICWQRYYLFDILDSNDIEYDQVLMVDADTIVHPDCPNFFEETNGEYGGVMTDGCYEWVNRSISNYHDNLFKSGWVYHFNSIPQNKENRNANYWIERVYKDLYE